MKHALAAALALLAACDLDPAGRCERTSDCLEGQVCDAGLCVAGPAPPANAAPAALPDAYAVGVGENFSCPSASGLLVNDADPDGDPLSAEGATAPAHGALYLSPDGSFVYVPHAGYAGEDVFTYRASDGSLRSAATAVTLTISP